MFDPKIFFVLPMLMSSIGCSSEYYDQYKQECEKRLQTSFHTTILSETEIACLPFPVQKYLHYTGAVGKPKVYNFRSHFQGEMKRKINADWMKITAQQHEFFGDIARLFYIKSSVYGIPFDGFHRYVGDSATMQIKIASLIKVADGKGEKMNQSETVTLFNDMCMFAPSTLIDTSIHWNLLD